MPMGSESVVIQSGDKLIGLLHPDYDEAKAMGLNDGDLANIMEQNRQDFNAVMPPYARLSEVRVHEEEFEKTPKKSIKRYLYTAQ